MILRDKKKGIQLEGFPVQNVFDEPVVYEDFRGSCDQNLRSEIFSRIRQLSTTVGSDSGVSDAQ